MQEGGRPLHPVGDVAHHEHLGVGRELPGDDGVEVEEAQSEGRPAEDAAQLDTARPLVGVVLDRFLPRSDREVDLPLFGADVHEAVGLEAFAEVDARLRHLHQGIPGLRRDVLDEEGRLALARHRVGRAEHEPEAVGEHQVLVDPSLAGDVLLVELAGGQHDLGEVPADGVAVDVDVLELVEGAQLLELAIGDPQHGRIPQAQVVDGVAIGSDIGCLELDGVAVGVRLLRELPHLHPRQPEGGPRGLDIAGDVRQLFVDLIRLDAEALDGGGDDAAHQDRRHQPQPESHRRQCPAPDADVHQEQDGCRQ